jgi:spore maturation protein CgeB
MKIATILDTFSYSVFSPEAELFQLTPDNWKTVFTSYTPVMLFVESAWRGKDDTWSGMIRHPSSELKKIIQYCNKYAIPTVFWNKEDPYHTYDFMETALLFDFVFTTDIECIPIYKKHLYHNHIYLLPFACQPKIHNPIEKYERKDAFVFAGSYYAYFPERNKYFKEALTTLSQISHFDIYDRNYGNNKNTNLIFPPEYHPFIKGKLEYHEIDKAYLGYKYALNLNSMTTSPTMFSRRVFELMASNTLVINNYTVGIKTLLGDLCISTNNMQELKDTIIRLRQDELFEKKMRLAALRKVMSEHTAKVRFNTLFSKVFPSYTAIEPSMILCITYVHTDQELCSVQNTFLKQTYKNKKLLLFLKETVNKHLVYTNESIGYTANFIDQSINIADYIAGLYAYDYYGENYLTDLILATQYTDALVITKSDGFTYTKQSGIIENKNYTPYTTTKYAYLRSSIVSTILIETSTLYTLATNLEHYSFRNINAYRIDEFNYCQNATESSLKMTEKSKLDDLAIDTGIQLTDSWINKQLAIYIHQKKYTILYSNKQTIREKISHQLRKFLKKMIPSYLISQLKKRTS